MFSIPKRDRVRNGVPTIEYNNVIHFNNVQHRLMAISMDLDVFSSDGYQHELNFESRA